MKLQFPMSDDDARMYFEKQDALQAARVVVKNYAFATKGAKTLRGGEVVSATGRSRICGHEVARVGDLVRYPDGSESRITSGAGFAVMVDGLPLAIVGSHVGADDHIISSLQDRFSITQFADAAPIPGLLQVGFQAPTAAAKCKS